MSTSFQTLVVNATTGVELSYIDSGPPSAHEPYTTIFAIHGMIFSNVVFQRMIALAPTQGVRVVAINRRGFPGSTPFTPEEFNVNLTGGSGDAEREAQMEARGHEIATFIAIFIQKFDLPAFSGAGRPGGAILLGWSLGAPFTTFAIANSDTLPEATREVLTSHVRSLILYEAAPIALGLPTPAQNWNPLMDSTIPASLRLEAFSQWVTAYFDHASTTDKALDSLSWVVTSPSRVPTLYGIPAVQLTAMIQLGAAASTDRPFLFFFHDQLLSAYRKAFYDASTAALFPNMKRAVLCGDKTAAFGIAGMWAVEVDHATTSPQAKVTYEMMSGTNHLGPWDDATTVLETVIRLA
ncbi:Alpha/Beta hydrolase protein [Mycena metata]|uniref:Alpha/Beta hydrolase protein n=1 Tax=Mycena metata TaxID=1033252 RepID=A0AAD7JI28_9AGAR|nr:Alpha/Beta hydrolase protein [Mycena metata]